ncbi:MAG: winged helix-turn-helix domain-containing protein [Rubrimonas sp.]
MTAASASAAQDHAAPAPAGGRKSAATGLRVRLVFGADAMIGPGKADLLERIRDTGSIAAAGRALGMSYKRAWMLVESMNATFAAPLVERQRGGAGVGGATLTAEGAQVLALWRALEARAAEAVAVETAALRAMLAPGAASRGNRAAGEGESRAGAGDAGRG